MLDFSNTEQNLLKLFGQEIAQKRQQLGLERDELAVSLNESESHLLKVEKGEISPGFLMILKLSKFLNLDLGELFKSIQP